MALTVAVGLVVLFVVVGLLANRRRGRGRPDVALSFQVSGEWSGPRLLRGNPSVRRPVVPRGRGRRPSTTCRAIPTESDDERNDA